MTNSNGAMRLYEHEGSSLYLHCGSPVREQIASDAVKHLNPHLTDSDLLKMVYAAFIIMEGNLGKYDLDAEIYPNLVEYLKEREKLTMLDRWHLYAGMEFSGAEFTLLRVGYESTRRHILETLADASDQEKKTSS